MPSLFENLFGFSLFAPDPFAGPPEPPCDSSRGVVADLVTRAALKRPYRRVLIPDEESGTITAWIEEFPGCIAQGDTPAEAYRRLEAAAESWVEAALEMGQSIPPPLGAART